MGKIKKQKQPVRVVSWEEYQTMVDKLAADMSNQSGKLLIVPKMNIWGIPRGGTIVAISLSHYNEEFFRYSDEDPLAAHLVEFSDWLDSFVVVDDIVDSGDTAERYSRKHQVASLFLREGASFEPDWYVEKIEDNTWIKFPWEKDI